MKTAIAVQSLLIVFLGCSGVSDKPVGSTSPSYQTAAQPSEIDIASLPRISQKLVAPPFLPLHDQIATHGPRIIEVTLRAVEKVVDIGGVQVHALTYNGSIPGPVIVAHEGDYVELTLVNPQTSLTRHTIDLHAATGALGGGRADESRSR